MRAKTKTRNRISLTQEQLEALMAKAVETAMAIRKAASIEVSDLLTRGEACKFLKVHSSTLWLWQKKNFIRPTKVGGRVYFLRSDLLKLFDKSLTN